MKKTIYILALLLSFSTQGISQSDNAESVITVDNTVKQESSNAMSIFEDRIEVGFGQLVPVFGYRLNVNTKLDDQNFNIHSLEAGISLVYGDSYSWSGNGPLGFLFGGGSSWQFIAPYVSLEARGLMKDTDSIPSRMRDYSSPLMLNGGFQFGFGDTDIFFLGFGGEAALSYDFNNLYAKLGAGIDLAGFGVHFGGFIPLTSNGEYANYLAGGFVDVRFLLWDRHHR